LRSKITDAIWILVLAAVSGAILWHVVAWHNDGSYARMFADIKAGHSLISALYNLGLMVVLGTCLGLLMERITRIAGYRVHERKHFEDDEGKEGL
jgi:hypothetical protein